jgi:hypothetical protein
VILTFILQFLPYSVLQIGALLTESHGQPNIHDGDITFMGYVMAKLPVDIQISKLILLGHIFSVLEECIIMGKLMGHNILETI